VISRMRAEAHELWRARPSDVEDTHPCDRPASTAATFPCGNRSEHAAVRVARTRTPRRP
jgi:hypothetical protein